MKILRSSISSKVEFLRPHDSNINDVNINASCTAVREEGNKDPPA